MATNLEFIKSAELTTPNSTFSVTDCFTDKYEVFAVVINKMSSANAIDDIRFRFINSSGTTISTANYDYAYLRMISFSAFSEYKSTNQTWLMSLSIDAYQEAQNIGAVIYVYNPTNTSSYTFCSWQTSYFNSGNGVEGNKAIGVLKTTDDITGILFGANFVNNLDEAKVSVFGVK